MISLLALALLPYVLAVPYANPIHIPITRRAMTPEQRVANLPQIMDSIRLKYGLKPVNQKRSVNSSPITDEENDSRYSAVGSVGTPPQPLNLILDTGSSDLWMATNQCATCSGVPLYNPSSSSSFKNGSTAVGINFGTGGVYGYIAQDTVTFSGFTLNQQFISVTQTSQGLLTDALSGGMGLGFQAISQIQTTPFWQALFNQNMLSSPVFSFYLMRYVDQTPTAEAPGGTFTLGGTNSSLYSGNIEFINMPSGSTPSYWLQQVKTVKVQGKSISVPSSETLASIDTGATIIAAPSDVTKQIWSNVANSVALTGSNQGLYAFPCSTSVSVSLSFGGTTWAIDPVDINLGPITVTGESNMCAGAIFDIGGVASSNAPNWIIGDTFLKNVYTVFQANPPAVGFAPLASGFNSSASASSGSSSSISAPPSVIVSMSLSLVVAILSGLFFTMW